MKRPLPMKIRELFDTYRKNEYAIHPYLLRDGKTHPVAVICPGGGYRRVCNFIEGYPFAKKLNKMGYHAIVVYYRVRALAVYPNPQDDLARAIREIHDHAVPWKLDMKNYSLWGSSAGGHLAGSFGTEAMGWKKYGLPRPGALVLVYPVVTMTEKTRITCFMPPPRYRPVSSEIEAPPWRMDCYRENWVVLDAATGQNAISQAREFASVTNLTGIVLTKMDGTAKGGIAIGVQSEVGVPVKFIGVGEKIEDLQRFNPDEYVDALFYRD